MLFWGKKNTQKTKTNILIMEHTAASFIGLTFPSLSSKLLALLTAGEIQRGRTACTQSCVLNENLKEEEANVKCKDAPEKAGSPANPATMNRMGKPRWSLILTELSYGRKKSQLLQEKRGF